MTPRSLSHRAPLLGLVVAWGAGSALAHSLTSAWSATLWAALALAGIALSWVGGARRGVVLGGLFLALFSAGALRTDQVRNRPGEWDALGLPPREARLTLRIEHPFSPAAGAQRAGGIAVVTGSEKHLRELVGQRIQFSVAWPNGTPPALRGVEFSALGLLRPVPALPEAGSFDRFVADEGANFSFTRARLLAPPGEAGAWSRFCDDASRRLETSLRAGLAGQDRLADLYVAMILGKKQELSETQHTLFIQSGTMHLFAISGLHIAGIAVALGTLLALARIPAQARFVIGTVALWAFVEITGGSPSAVRAFWMVTCLLGARQFRTPTNSLAALSGSALVVLVFDPHQLFSASFQMSYGIVMAILLYGVPLQEKWQEAWHPWANLPPASLGLWRRSTEEVGRGLLGAMALGFASALVSIPSTLAFFSLLTPGGFFVNLVLIPVSALVLFSGFASMLTGGLGLFPVASLFNHAAALVLDGMEWTVVQALRVPGSAWPAHFVLSWVAPLASAGLLGLLALGYTRGWRTREGGYWAPYAVMALVLVLGVRVA